MHIYEIRDQKTERRYVGQTLYEDIQKRWQEHKTTLRSGKHFNIFLQRAWNKHGEQNFEFSILDSSPTTLDELDRLETLYINKYKTMDRRRGFNLRDGGMTNRFSDRSRAKLSKAAKAQWKRMNEKDKLLLRAKISTATKNAMAKIRQEQPDKWGRITSSWKKQDPKVLLANARKGSKEAAKVLRGRKLTQKQKDHLSKKLREFYQKKGIK